MQFQGKINVKEGIRVESHGEPRIGIKVICELQKSAGDYHRRTTEQSVSVRKRRVTLR